MGWICLNSKFLFYFNNEFVLYKIKIVLATKIYIVLRYETIKF